MELQVSDLMPLFWSIIGLVGVSLSYKLAKFFLLAKSETKSHLREQIKDLKEQVLDHKKEAQRWRGKFGNKEVKPTVEGNPEDIESFIPQLIESYGHLAPNWMKPFLHDKNTIKFLIEEAKKNPDAAKSILANFVGKPQIKSENGQLQTESNPYAELA